MNIVMMTNTYKPIIGGLEKSVEVFSDEYRNRGHKVLIVCPEFKGAPKKEKDVIRVSAIQNFNHTDFSVELPISNKLNNALERFQPDIIHAHHPFLIGDTAVRASARFNVPIVFTNHTLYEENTHYVPAGNSQAMKEFVKKLAKGYADLCDRVIAPSASVADILKERGVKTPIEVLSTGIYIDQFKRGDGETFRKFFDIPQQAFVVGIIGRIAPEKNVLFLSKAVTTFLKKNKKAYFVVIGSGSSLEDIQAYFKKSKLDDRLVCAGILKGNQLISAYHALDVFAFSSHSETQGLVLVEAMASGTPVVGVDAPGVREVIKDKINGRIIENDNVRKFVEALSWVGKLSSEEYNVLNKNAQKTAQEFSVTRCIDKALKIYSDAIKNYSKERDWEDNLWKRTLRSLKVQSELIANTSQATATAIASIPATTVKQTTRKIKKAIHKITKEVKKI